MNLLSRIKAASNAMFGNVVQASLPNGVLEFMARYGKVPDVSQMALVQKYFGWTHACANISATRFSTVPLRLYASRGVGQSLVKNFSCKKVDKRQSAWLRKRLSKSLTNVAGAEDFEELEEHPLLDLLQNVNDQENGFEIKELTCLMLDLTGDAYWMIEKDRLGVPSKFFVLRSQWMRIIPDREKFISGYWYGYNNAWGTDTRLELTPDQVIHFKYPNPVDPWYGMGPVQAAAYAIESQELREKFILATMGNMARPDLIVKYLEGELDPKERQAVEREWNATFRGAKNAGKVKVTDFRYEIDKVGWNPSELDFNKGEDWIMKKIASAFPVPVGLIDTTSISRAPKAGMEGVEQFLGKFNTLPRCTRVEQKLNEQLCPLYDSRLFLAFDNPVEQDRAFQNQEDDTRLKNFSTTINEIRKRDGEEEVEWGDVPLTPPGIAPLGSTTTPSEPGPGDTTIPPAKRGQAANGDGKATGTLGGASMDGIAKALGDGLEMEVEGQYVHPTLAGVPIKLRVRNDGGRFDKHDPDKIRVRRDVLDSLKLKGDLPGHEFHGNQYSDGAGGGSDRNSDEASDARYFNDQQKQADEAVSRISAALNEKRAEIASAIKEHDAKVAASSKDNAAKLEAMGQQLKANQAALAEVQQRKAGLQKELDASKSRMDALREEWTTKFPNTPLPRAFRPKAKAVPDLKKKIVDEVSTFEDLVSQMCDLADEVEAL